jgi:hypothetical protein
MHPAIRPAARLLLVADMEQTTQLDKAQHHPDLASLSKTRAANAGSDKTATCFAVSHVAQAVPDVLQAAAGLLLLHKLSQHRYSMLLLTLFLNVTCYLPLCGLRCLHTPAALHATLAAPDAAPAAASLTPTQRKPAHVLAARSLLRAAARPLLPHQLLATD